jgi:hypothetical protein
LGRSADANIVFSGQKTGINVIANSENNVGTIDFFAFVPNLQAPADGAVVDAGAMVLEWTEVAGAANYRVIVHKNSNMSDSIVDATTLTANYTPSRLSNEQTYYWQVFAVDPNGNAGIGSQIWSFSSPANTSPVVQISTPAKGSTYTVDENIEFTGNARR